MYIFTISVQSDMFLHELRDNKLRLRLEVASNKSRLTASAGIYTLHEFCTRFATDQVINLNFHFHRNRLFET